MTEHELLEILQKEVDRINSTRTSDYLKNKNISAPPISYLRKRIGTWEECMRKLERTTTPSKRTDNSRFNKLSDTQILQIIYDELIRLNTLSGADYIRDKKKKSPSMKYLRKRFKTWSNVLERLDAEFSITEVRKRTIANNIKNAFKPNVPLTLENYKNIKKNNLPTVTELRKIYGSWANCMYFMGEEDDKVIYREFSKEELLKEGITQIKQTYAVTRQDFDVLRDTNSPSSAFLTQKFKGWKNFINQACLSDPEVLEIVSNSRNLENQKIRALKGLLKLEEDFAKRLEYLL